MRTRSRVPDRVATLWNKFGSGDTGKEEIPPGPDLPTAATLGRTHRRQPRPVQCPPACRTAPRGASRLARGHSPSSLSPDPKPTPLLRVLNPKLPRTSDCSRSREPCTSVRAGTSERARQARRAPRLSGRPERVDNSWTCSANEADSGAEATGLRREAGPRGGRGGASPWVGPAGAGRLLPVTGGACSQSRWLQESGRPLAGPSARLRPAAAIQSVAAEAWRGDAPVAEKLAAVGSLSCGLALWGQLRGDSGVLGGKWRPQETLAERGLGPPRPLGVAAYRRAVEGEAQPQREQTPGRQRPHLASAGGAELGPEGAPALGRNRDPKRVSPGPHHPVTVGGPGLKLELRAVWKRFWLRFGGSLRNETRTPRTSWKVLTRPLLSPAFLPPATGNLTKRLGSLPNP